MTSPADVVPLTSVHATQVLAIYQAGIDEGNATFETEAPAWARFDATKLPGHRLVALDPGTQDVLGWIAASQISDRCAYAGVVEHSVYVHPHARGRGIARTLLNALITSTETAGIWTIQSGIFPENAPASPCTGPPASASSADANASAATTAAGATSSSSNAAAHTSPSSIDTARPAGRARVPPCYQITPKAIASSVGRLVVEGRFRPAAWGGSR